MDIDIGLMPAQSQIRQICGLANERGYKVSEQEMRGLAIFYKLTRRKMAGVIDTLQGVWRDNRC